MWEDGGGDSASYPIAYLPVAAPTPITVAMAASPSDIVKISIPVSATSKGVM